MAGRAGTKSSLLYGTANTVTWKKTQRREGKALTGKRAWRLPFLWAVGMPTAIISSLSGLPDRSVYPDKLRKVKHVVESEKDRGFISQVLEEMINEAEAGLPLICSEEEKKKAQHDIAVLRRELEWFRRDGDLHRVLKAVRLPL